MCRLGSTGLLLAPVVSDSLHGDRVTLGHGSLECLGGQPRGYPWQAHLDKPVLTHRATLPWQNTIDLLAMDGGHYYLTNYYKQLLIFLLHFSQHMHESTILASSMTLIHLNTTIYTVFCTSNCVCQHM